MGVDSGLPDFRGNQGFWRAYPPLKELGLSFYDMANPSWFADDPPRAWGFYGHRRNLYRQTEPHAGFAILKKWSQHMPHGAFVFTSNVDGHFQKAGFSDEQVVECHGSIEFDQCVSPCCHQIWEAVDSPIDVDPGTFRAAEPLPQCQFCGGISRPNILMFGDWNWIESRTSRQYRRLETWLKKIRHGNLLIIEIGAGTAVSTVRHQCDQVADHWDANHVRINPRESHGRDVISIACGGLPALEAIDNSFDRR